MKRLFPILALATIALGAVGQTHVQFVLTDPLWSTTYTTNRNILVWTEVITAHGGGYGVASRRKYTTDTNSQVTLSNIVNGLYGFEVQAPPTTTRGMFLVTEAESGTVNVTNLLAASAQSTFPPGSVSWSATASDARYAGIGSVGITNASDLAGALLAETNMHVSGQLIASNTTTLRSTLNVGTGSNSVTSTFNQGAFGSFNVTAFDGLFSGSGFRFDDALEVREDFQVNTGDGSADATFTLGGGTFQVSAAATDLTGAIANSGGNLNLNDAVDVAGALNVTGKQTNADYVLFGTTTATAVPSGSYGLGRAATGISHLSGPHSWIVRLDNNDDSTSTFTIQDGDATARFTVDESGDVSIHGSYYGIATSLTNGGGAGIVFSNSVVPLSAPLSVGATNTGGYGIVWSNSVVPLSAPLSVDHTNVNGSVILVTGEAPTYEESTNIAATVFTEMFEAAIQTNVTQLTLSGVPSGTPLNTDTNVYLGLPYFQTAYNAASNCADYLWLVPPHVDTNYAMAMKVGIIKLAADPTDVAVIEAAYLPITLGTTVVSGTPSSGLISTTNDLGATGSASLITFDLSAWAGAIVPGQAVKIRVQRAGGNASETYGNSVAVVPPAVYWVPQ